MISSGPHHTNIGNRLLRQMSTATRSASGQSSTGPSGVFDQSFSRTRRDISPTEDDDDGDCGNDKVADHGLDIFKLRSTPPCTFKQ